MTRIETVEALFARHGFTDFRWLDAKEIVVAEWVRMKCRFGCAGYGHSAACPPATPSVEECGRFFRDYEKTAVFHFEKKVEKPEDRHAWSRGVNAELLKLERDVFLAGYPKAFLVAMDSCSLCETCAGRRERCVNPKEARPTADALAVDVYTTVRKLGYPIQVLPDYDRAMNRYAFLLVE